MLPSCVTLSCCGVADCSAPPQGGNLDPTSPYGETLCSLSQVLAAWVSFSVSRGAHSSSAAAEEEVTGFSEKRGGGSVLVPLTDPALPLHFTALLRRAAEC